MVAHVVSTATLAVEDQGYGVSGKGGHVEALLAVAVAGIDDLIVKRHIDCVRTVNRCGTRVGEAMGGGYAEVY